MLKIIRSYAISSLLSIGLFFFLALVLPAAGQAGDLLRSDRDGRLAINALNGAVEGASLALVNTCTPDNPDCTWTFRNGMIISDRNPQLAINATNGARHGTQLHLTASCTPTNPDCTWKFTKGRLVSDRDPTLAINAWNGAANGTLLRLHNSCETNNPDCTWSIFRFVRTNDPEPQQCTQGGPRARCICECNGMDDGPQKTACLNQCPR